MVEKAVEVSVHFEGEVFLYGGEKCSATTKGHFVIVFHKYKDGELFGKSYREYPINELESRVESLVNIVKDADLDDFGISIGSFMLDTEENEWIYLDDSLCIVEKGKNNVVKRWLNALSNGLVVNGVDYNELVKKVDEYIKWHHDIGISNFYLEVDKYAKERDGDYSLEVEKPVDEDKEIFYGVTMYSAYREDGKDYGDFPEVLFEADDKWVAEEVEQILHSLVWRQLSE